MGDMTDAEFAAKVEWEGGFWSALAYGLRSSDLANQNSDLALAWRSLEIAYKQLETSGVLDILENALDEASEE